MDITYVTLSELLTYTMMLTSVVTLCDVIFSNKNHKK